LGGSEFTDNDKKGLCRVPGAYLGRYLVKEATPQRLVVEPADQLTPGQGQQLPKRLAWVLYEKLPTDTHEMFAVEDAAKKQAMLPALLPFDRFGKRGIPISPAAHRAMVQEYLRDGQETGREDNPLRVQQEIEFVKPYTQQVDLEIDGELPETDRPFNADGRAQMKSVMLGGPAEFKEGNTAVVDGWTADRLTRQEGVAKAVGAPKYSRQLRDYQFMLSDFQTQFNVVGREKAVIQDQVNDLNASLKRLQEQIDKHVTELELLQADQKGFQVEKEQLEAYKQILEQRLGILQGEIQTRSFVTR
jgi:archaellum component FlaC